MIRIFLIFSLLFTIASSSLVKVDEFNDFSDEFSPKQVEIFDPLSGYNRVMTTFNDKVYIYVFNPITKTYTYVVPEVGRVGISNFFNNLLFPIRFVNNLLQFKFKNSFEELERFVVNSTFGLLGFMDPASKNLKIEQHNEDFGQTLGHYGISSGFHIVLPFLGPSNLRDTFSSFADAYVSPINDRSALNYKIPDNQTQTLYIGFGKYINSNSFDLGKYENLKKDALDLYPFLRDIYEQKREKDIKE